METAEKNFAVHSEPAAMKVRRLLLKTRSLQKMYPRYPPTALNPS